MSHNINWKHPLARQLKGWTHVAQNNLIYKQAPDQFHVDQMDNSIYDHTTIPSTNGYVLPTYHYQSATNDAFSEIELNWAPSASEGGFTFFVVSARQPTTFAENDFFITGQNAPPWQMHMYYDVQASTDHRWGIHVVNGVWSARKEYITLPNPTGGSINEYFTFAASFGNSGVHLYVNGIEQTSTVELSTLSYAAFNFNSPVLLGRHIQTWRTRYPINAEGIFSAELSPQEIMALHTNPWQIYEPKRVVVAVEPRSDTFRLLEVQGTPTETGIDITLVDSTGAALPNLSNLSWAWFDQSTIDSASTPTDVGNTGSTDGSGLLSLTLSNTTLTTGETGMLALRDSTGMIYALYRITI